MLIDITSSIYEVKCIFIFHRYTSKKNQSGDVSVYAIVLDWPEKTELKLAVPYTTGKTGVTLLGYPGVIGWKAPAETKVGINIKIPVIPFNKQPCNYAWVFKMTNLQN